VPGAVGGNVGCSVVVAEGAREGIADGAGVAVGDIVGKAEGDVGEGVGTPVLDSTYLTATS